MRSCELLPKVSTRAEIVANRIPVAVVRAWPLYLGATLIGGLSVWNGKESDVQLLQTWIRHCPALKFAISPDAKILWGNEAFCAGIGYSLSEVRQRTLPQISVPGADLEASLAELRLLDGNSTCYTVTLQLAPKNDRPQWGKLTVMRYPMDGPIQCGLCTWAPITNGNAAAFALAVDAIERFEKQAETVATEIKALTTQSDQDRVALFLSKMVTKHPKWIVAGLIVLATMVGGNNALAIFQRLGLVALPHVITEPQQSPPPKQAATRSAEDFLLQADGIGYSRPTLTVDNRHGLRVEWRPKAQPIVDLMRGEQL